MRLFDDLLRNAGSAIAAFVMIFASAALAADARAIPAGHAILVSSLIGFGVVQLTAALAGRAAPVWLFGLFVVALVNLLARALRVAVEVEGLGATLISYAIVVMALWLLSKVRLPFVCKMTASVTIAAPREAVWGTIEYRPRRDVWKPYVAQLAAVPGQPDCVRQIMRGPDGETLAGLIIKVSDVLPGESFALEAVVEPNPASTATPIRNRSWHRLSDVKGGVRYETIETAQGLTLGEWVFGALVNPPLDSLRQLKAFMEGGEDRSFAAAFAPEPGADSSSV